MPLEIPAKAQAILAEIDSKQEALSEMDINVQLSKLRPSLQENERQALWVETAAFLFQHGEDDSSVWGTYFRPIGSCGDGENTQHTPDIREADAEVVQYWEKRSAEAQHPVLRARYADLVWDLEKAITGSNPRVEYARIAIESYIAAADRALFEKPIYGSRYLKRALSLAIAINDPACIQAAKDAMFRLFRAIADPRFQGRWIFLFDSLYGNKKVMLTSDELQFIIDSLENLLDRCCTPGAEFDPHAAQAAAERLAHHYNRLGQTNQAQRVTRAYGQAFEYISQKADPALALAWLQPVYEKYRNTGMAEDAVRVQLLSKQKGERIHESMRTLSVEIKISQQELSEYLAALTDGGLAEALSRIAGTFIPRSNEAQDSLKFLQEKRPLLAMISVVRVADAQIVSAAGNIEDDPEGRLLMEMARQVDFQAPFLAAAIDEAVRRYDAKPDDVLGFLLASPIVSGDRKEIILQGITAQFTGDYLKAIHLLIPQIEHSLRTVLALLDIPTNRPMRSSKGVMQEKSLNDVLETEAIRKLFGQDLWLYLREYLEDPRGHNVRNRVCHGLALPSELNRQTADRVFHILLVCGLIRRGE